MRRSRGLFVFPKPCVAALNGHAIAGGAILAFACDHRLMSGGRIGVPEPLVGVPFPPLAMAIVRYAVPKPHLQPMVYFGKTMDAEAAKEMGIVDEVVARRRSARRARTIDRRAADVGSARRRSASRSASCASRISAMRRTSRWPRPMRSTRSGRRRRRMRTFASIWRRRSGRSSAASARGNGFTRRSRRGGARGEVLRALRALRVNRSLSLASSMRHAACIASTPHQPHDQRRNDETFPVIRPGVPVPRRPPARRAEPRDPLHRRRMGRLGLHQRSRPASPC